MKSIRDYQNWVKEAWKKSSKTVDEKDELLFLIEEMGEMAEAVRKLKGNKDNKNFDANIEKEMGDILLSLMTLSIRYDVDLEAAFEKTIDSVKKRYM